MYNCSASIVCCLDITLLYTTSPCTYKGTLFTTHPNLTFSTSHCLSIIVLTRVMVLRYTHARICRLTLYIKMLRNTINVQINKIFRYKLRYLGVKNGKLKKVAKCETMNWAVIFYMCNEIFMVHFTKKYKGCIKC